MLKKTITYTDFNGLERTEDFFFNFTESELAMMEMTKEGGLTTALQRMVNAKENTTLMVEYEKLLLNAYGIKSDDGRRFEKSPEISKAFKEHPAYSEIFLSLFRDEKAASEFINGVFPAKLLKEAATDLAELGIEPVKLA